MERIKQMMSLQQSALTESNRSKKVERIIQEVIFDSIKDSIFLLMVEEGLEFKYVAINESALALSGLEGNCIGKALQDVHKSVYADHLQKKYEQVVHQKQPLSYQDRIVLPNKQVMYGESIITPILDEHDVCRFLVSITRDITESVNEKNKLIFSEQRYRSLFDHNLDPIFIIDTNGVFLSANPSTYNLTGYSEYDILQKPIFSFVINEDQENFKDIFKKTIKEGKQESITCHFIHKNKQNLRMHFKTVPIIINERIMGIYVMARDVTKQYEDEQTIIHMAYHDDLTGLPNRSSLKTKLDELLCRGKINQTNLAVMFIDLDRFKFLNDTLGHNIGDLLLKKVARRLSNLINQKGTVFRQGGDEFIILLNDLQRDEVEQHAKDILKAFGDSFQLNKQEYYISPSIGISFYPNDGEDEETLLKNADTALYRVKERGKGHYQFYTKDMRKGTPRALQLENGLRKAAYNEELVLYFQPQVHLVTGEVTSFEALLRWDSPSLGFISPGEFIPLAEESGMIIPIGRWVIQAACRQIRMWIDEGYKPVTIAINISTRQFQQIDLVENIRDAITKYQVEPRFLDIEITEGAMFDAREAVSILKRLKEIGVQVSIDDFGTGYSSLSHLKRFPIDTLKIDQSFVRDVLCDEDSKAIVKTIVQMANTMGMDVIAEGVEVVEQIHFLEKLKCQKIQGFYYSKPITAKEVEQTYLKKST